MKTFDNEIVVHRNETFCIDKLVQNKDGSPYVISNKLNNPFFLITVSTTRYDQRDRYVLNYWLPVNIPRFNSTNAVNLRDIKDAQGQTKYNDFSDVTYHIPLVEGFIDGRPVSFNAEDAVFYVEDNDVRRYKYCTPDKGWNDYFCRIVKLFMSDETKMWVEQSYVYSIQLVSGVSMLSYLQKICNDNNIHYDESFTKEDLFIILSKNNLAPNLDAGRELAIVDNVYTILAPTKLSVLSSLQGEL